MLFLINDVYAEIKQYQEFKSPDGKFVAFVTALPKAQYGYGESKVEIRTKKGKLLCSKSYGSEDGEHGFGVERAAWTPNSKFFVYSMSSSGGHQSWHFPTYFVSINDFIIKNLDNYLGPITDPNFELFSPDIIQGIGQDIADIEKEIKFKTNLGDIK